MYRVMCVALVLVPLPVVAGFGDLVKLPQRTVRHVGRAAGNVLGDVGHTVGHVGRAAGGILSDVGRATGVAAVVGAGVLYEERRRQEQAASAHAEQQRREQARRQQERERVQEAQRKERVLAQLDAECETTEKNVREVDAALVQERDRIMAIERDIATAEHAYAAWQQESAEREQHVKTLREQLQSCSSEYEKKREPLERIHAQRVQALEGKIAGELAVAQQKHAAQENSWRAQAKQEKAVLDLLCHERRSLEDQLVEQEERMNHDRRSLAEAVISAIDRGVANPDAVVSALAHVGGNQGILTAAVHAHNSSLLIALILSGVFKPYDLQGADATPKVFFREVERQLSDVSAPADEIAPWLRRVHDLGKRTFLCFSC